MDCSLSPISVPSYTDQDYTEIENLFIEEDFYSVMLQHIIEDENNINIKTIASFNEMNEIESDFIDTLNKRQYQYL